MSMFQKVFGTHSEREVKRIKPLVDQIEALRPTMQALSDEDLRNKTTEFKERLSKGETLDDLLPEAFAVVREADKRVLGMEPYRVQLIGGIILHQGRIAEMKTGEGKTLVSTLPAYLNALEGKGVCIVTVNDYLAKRDSEWMGQVHEFLGLKVGVVLNEMTNDERRRRMLRAFPGLKHGVKKTTLKALRLGLTRRESPEEEPKKNGSDTRKDA